LKFLEVRELSNITAHIRSWSQDPEAGTYADADGDLAPARCFKENGCGKWANNNSCKWTSKGKKVKCKKIKKAKKKPYTWTESDAEELCCRIPHCEWDDRKSKCSGPKLAW
jgi:hypothetical protein